MTPANPNCYMDDHDWRGATCAACGERLRCYCGVFADGSDQWWGRHMGRCPVVREADRLEREAIEGGWL